jgi:hypothetical protein
MENHGNQGLEFGIVKTQHDLQLGRMFHPAKIEGLWQQTAGFKVQDVRVSSHAYKTEENWLTQTNDARSLACVPRTDH